MIAKIARIRTEEDYEAALARIYEIFHAKIGTLDGDERDALLDLVEVYENERYPIPNPSDPIAAIEFEMDQRGLSVDDLAAHVGGAAEAKAVLSGKREITTPMAMVLHKRLGISLDTLIGNRRQAVVGD